MVEIHKLMWVKQCHKPPKFGNGLYIPHIIHIFILMTGGWFMKLCCPHQDIPSICPFYFHFTTMFVAILDEYPCFPEISKGPLALSFGGTKRELIIRKWVEPAQFPQPHETPLIVSTGTCILQINALFPIYIPVKNHHQYCCERVPIPQDSLRTDFDRSSASHLDGRKVTRFLQQVTRYDKTI